MADRPILFSGPMVRALLDGRKTQTRRVLKKPLPPEDADRVFTWFPPTDVPIEGIENQWAEGGLWADQHMEGEPGEPGFKGGYKRHVGFLPYRPGDRLWVRETFTLTQHDHPVYRADATDQSGKRWTTIAPGDPDGEVTWKPSIFMPRWASRLTLTVTDVRVQRLQDITNEDCIAEGVPIHPNPNAPRTGPALDDFARKHGLISHYGAEFRALWDSLNAKRGFGWEDNPWVTATTFTVLRSNIDDLEVAA